MHVSERHIAPFPHHFLSTMFRNNLLKPLLANQRPSAHRVGPLFAAQLRRISIPARSADLLCP
jgi:hypothetical protein